MKTYMFEGKEYVENGECRAPKRGEIFMSEEGFTKRADINYSIIERVILIPKEKRMDKKYEILEDITPTVIFEKGDLSCKEFCKEYSEFLRWFVYRRNKKFNERLDQDDICDMHNIKWINFLIDKELIREKMKEKTTYYTGYYTGQKFRLRSDIYILSRIRDKAFLINLETGNVWKADGTDVRYFNGIITKSEFKQIADGTFTKAEDFELIEE